MLSLEKLLINGTEVVREIGKARQMCKGVDNLIVEIIYLREDV